MNHIGLFEGVGGFSLAAHWQNWVTKAWVEIDDSCKLVLRDKFSEATGHDDIYKFDGKAYRGTIDILTGGFPCQSFSLAGKGAMDLSLWKEMLRVVDEVKPPVVLAENVLGILVRKDGVALETVCSDLEGIGYQVLPPIVIPACGKGAPHRRNRVWIVAYSHSNGSERWRFRSHRSQAQEGKIKKGKWQWVRNDTFGNAKSGLVANANANAQGLQDRVQSGRRCHEKAYGAWSWSQSARAYPKNDWSQFPTESPISTGDDGLPNKLDKSYERFRKRSIKAGGNAISPQIALEIFRSIEAFYKKEMEDFENYGITEQEKQA